MRPYILILIVLGLSLFSSCYKETSVDSTFSDRVLATTPSVTPQPSPTVERKYEGTSIDEVFPIGFHVSFIENKEQPPTSFNIGDFTVRAKDYVPLSLEKEGKTVFRFPRRETDGYWATLAGGSQLRGKGKQELYFVVSGPGAVCCTNYTIVDVSDKMPRKIFHSEDFGRFRNPMEVFDADNDGIYELVQFDSCLRYFKEDCGSCSPEPRVYFKYRADRRSYWPAKGVLQDFVRKGFAQTETWIGEKYSEWRKTKDVAIELDLRRSLIAHVADLLHVGEEQKAWAQFRLYPELLDASDRKELTKRLRECRAYRALKEK